jgi:hypothetical protein
MITITQPTRRGAQSPTGYQLRKTYRSGDSVPVRLSGNLLGQIAVEAIFA